jgi:hypothetical protein
VSGQQLVFVQEGAQTGVRSAAGREVSKNLAATAASTAASTALASVGVAGAQTVAVSLTASLLTAAGASAAVPYAGWIVAGALLTTAAVTAIVAKFANFGRRLALVYAEKNFGEEGGRFAREFANSSQKETAAIQSRIIALTGKISRTKRFRSTVRRRVKIGRLKGQLNANLIILQQRAALPEAAAAAHEPPAVVIQARAQRSPDLLNGISGPAAIGLLALAAVATGVFVIAQEAEEVE